MLVVRRREGQSILIGDEIEIEIIELSSAKVKIGVHAPRTVTVQRKEVQMVRERNLASAGISPNLREAIAGRILASQNISQQPTASVDKTFEGRYTGHPEDRRTRARHDAGMYP